MITSLSNPLVKSVSAFNKKASLRKEEGLFVVEGRRFCEELPAGQLEKAFVTEAFLELPEGRSLAERLKAETVSQAVMEKMADTKTPQGILALARMREASPEDFGSGPLLVLEHVQDPGNVGTLFRTAEAAGAGGVILDRETADPYSPKVLRATMGAIFRLPFVISDDLPGLLRQLKAQGFSLTAAHLAGTEFYDAVSYPARTAFLIGNEGNGLSEEITSLADKKVRIPMEGRTESLNAAVAGALLLYEAYRQKRSGT